MSTKHKWSKQSYFTDLCLKCGCIRNRKIGAYATYERDGKSFDYAPVCDGRFMPTVPKNFVIEFEQ